MLIERTERGRNNISPVASTCSCQHQQRNPLNPCHRSASTASPILSNSFTSTSTKKNFKKYAKSSPVSTI